MDRLLGYLPGWELGECSMKALLYVQCQTHENSAACLVWNGDQRLECLDDSLGEPWEAVRCCGQAGCSLSCNVLSDPSKRFVFSLSEDAATSKNDPEILLGDFPAQEEDPILKSLLRATIRAREEDIKEETVLDPDPEGNFPCLIQPMDWYEPRSSARIEEAMKKPSIYPLIDFEAPQEQQIEKPTLNPDLIGLEEVLLAPPVPLVISDHQYLDFECRELDTEDDLIIFDDDSSDSDVDSVSDSDESDSGGSQSSQSEPETPPNELESGSKSEQESTTEADSESKSAWVDFDYPFADSPFPEPQVRFEFPFALFPIIEFDPQPNAESDTGTDEAKVEDSPDTIKTEKEPKVKAVDTNAASLDNIPDTQKSNDAKPESSLDSSSGLKQTPTMTTPEIPPLDEKVEGTEAPAGDVHESSGENESDAQQVACKTDSSQTPTTDSVEVPTDKTEPQTDDQTESQKESKPETKPDENPETESENKTPDEPETPKDGEPEAESENETDDDPSPPPETQVEVPPEDNAEEHVEQKPEEEKSEEAEGKDTKPEKKKKSQKKKKPKKRKTERPNRRYQSLHTTTDNPPLPLEVNDNLLDLVSSENTWEDEQFEPLCSEPKDPFRPNPGPWKAEWDWWEERKERIEEEDESDDDEEKGDQSKSKSGSDESNAEKPAEPALDQGPVPYPDGIKDLMKMVGIEDVKDAFLNLMSLVTVSKSSTLSMQKERLGAVFTGNPGTGKTTTARLYGKVLSSLGLVGGTDFEETSGEHLYAHGVKEAKRLIDNLMVEGGGVLFIDEAYPMAEHTHCAELNYILSRVEELAGQVVFVFAGYAKEMERFTSRNAGFASRIPAEFKFADFKDDELHQILIQELKEKFGDNMAVEGGWNGRYMRVVARRVGRGRGSRGFGNAREVQNMVSVISKRYAKRVFHHMKEDAIERNEWRTLPVNKEHHVLTVADLVGPEPSKALTQSDAWKELSAMVGLESVKHALRALVVRLQTNYERELAEEPIISSSLHKVFLGNPGTGKTTVAKYYAQILADMGLLTKGEVLLKDPSDFIGEYVGHSEGNTRRILEAAKGNVLVIDEAYMLGPRYDGGTGKADSFKTAVIDTLVAQVQATGNEDMAIILLGYREPMQAMLNNVNPGMARRFPLSSAFEFNDYSRDELKMILRTRLSEQGLRVSEKAEKVALDVLDRSRNRQHFGNAGEVDIMLDRAKDRQQERLAENPDSYKRTLLEPQDLDPDFDRADRAASNVKALFKDYIGFDEIVKRLVGYQNVARNMKRVGMDPREDIPFTYLFRGPPGTGKTSTARQIGKVFYDMGLLATDEVIECSASELIGEYCGQTGPKTQRVFNKALGKVLIIDEAYRLNDGKFGVEAVSEIVNLLTKNEYQNKLVTVLAGYEDEINKLMEGNPGLTSRFPVSFNFPSLTAEQCFELLLQELRSRKLSVGRLTSSKNVKSQALSNFSTLTLLPAWGNARDVRTLAKQLMMRIMSSSDFDPDLEVPGELLKEELREMIKEREKRGGALPPGALNYYI